MALVPNGLEALVACALQEVAERHLVGHVVVEHRLDGHRVAQDPRGFEQLPDVAHDHRQPGRVDLDSSRRIQAHDPDPLRAAAQEVRDLALQQLLVLADSGVLHRERRNAWEPARSVGAHSIGRPSEISQLSPGLTCSARNGPGASYRLASLMR